MPLLGGVRRALSRRSPRLALPALAAIASLTAAVPASAAPPALTAAVAPAANVRVHAKTVEVDYATEPQRFTVDCGPDEEVLSGGYSAPDPAVRVVSSYPSNPQGVATPDGARPRSWTVGVAPLDEEGPRPRLSLAATCLAGDAGAASRVAVLTQTRAESAYSLTADCPTGTARTGGGHASLWPSDSDNAGLAVVRSSYPVARGWRVDVTNSPIEGPLPPTASVYAVCLASGDLEVAEREPVNVDLVAGPPACDEVSCVTSRSGVRTVQCGEGQLFAGAGYQISDPSLSLDSVRIATPAAGPVVATPAAGPVWTVVVSGSTQLPATAQPTPIRMVVRTLRLVAEPAVSTAGPAPTTENPALPPPELQARSDFSVLVGAGSIVLALLLLLLLLALRASRRGGRRRLAGSVEVVVRGVRTGYRIGGERR